MPLIKKTSKRTNRGVIALVVILSIIIFAPRVITYLKGYKDLSVSIVELDEGVAQIEEAKKLSKSKKVYKSNKFKVPPRKFDPNTYSIKDWMYLGLTEKQASAAVNFLKRGVYDHEQLRTCFVIKDEMFQLMKDSIYYPVNPKIKQKNDFKVVEIKLIDINTADEAGLMQIKGIGEFYAKKIIEYRDKLGGFHSKEQLLELYKFDQEKLDRISSQISLGSAPVQQININTASAEELAVHPYIRWKIANSIVKMRAQVGKYSKVEQLLDSELIDKVLLEKLKPYLTL